MKPNFINRVIHAVFLNFHISINRANLFELFKTVMILSLTEKSNFSHRVISNLNHCRFILKNWSGMLLIFLIVGYLVRVQVLVKILFCSCLCLCRIFKTLFDATFHCTAHVMPTGICEVTGPLEYATST